ncbi:hypothetical protein AR1Y2_2340 [Anaerostipes rhamnosivorans]|uniref:Uncharacterized protein n=1 Tax=Anaerostipes rhamnosivorans TaxID=1229621 RepID=A0A4P8IIP3_9FIRM|nr:hypothetical protein AR1Y2_2340 [Anaerostipes rhamnosivorans]
MKRVCGVAFFFFGLGLFIGLFIQRDFTQFAMTGVCISLSYFLFFQ